MHLFTITIHSNLFGKDLSDEILEEMANAYFDEFQKSLKKHGLSEFFSTEVYWSRGSLVEWITLTLENAPLVELFSANLAYKTFKDYEKLRNTVILVSKDLRHFKKKISGENLSTKEVHVCDTKPSNKAKKLKVKLKNPKDHGKSSNK